MASLILLIVPVLLFTIALVVTSSFTAANSDPSRCSACAYDLTGQLADAGTCPECGTLYNRLAAAAPSLSFSRANAGIGTPFALALCSAAACALLMQVGDLPMYLGSTALSFLPWIIILLRLRTRTRPRDWSRLALVGGIALCAVWTALLLWYFLSFKPKRTPDVLVAVILGTYIQVTLSSLAALVAAIFAWRWAWKPYSPP